MINKHTEQFSRIIYKQLLLRKTFQRLLISASAIETNSHILRTIETFTKKSNSFLILTFFSQPQLTIQIIFQSFLLYFHICIFSYYLILIITLHYSSWPSSSIEIFLFGLKAKNNFESTNSIIFLCQRNK